MDSNVPKFGGTLVNDNVCVENSMYLLNGRTLGNIHGLFICYPLQGSSDVDYFICSQDLSINVVKTTIECILGSLPIRLIKYTCL